MLLMGGNPHDVRRHLVYLRALNKARLASIDTAQRRAERVAAIRAETQSRLAELEQVVQQSREQRAVLERERKERQKMLARIASQLEQRRRALATAQADESRLPRLVARLTALLEARARAAQRAPKAGRSARGLGKRGTECLRARAGTRRIAVGKPADRHGALQGKAGDAGDRGTRRALRRPTGGGGFGQSGVERLVHPGRRRARRSRPSPPVGLFSPTGCGGSETC